MEGGPRRPQQRAGGSGSLPVCEERRKHANPMALISREEVGWSRAQVLGPRATGLTPSFGGVGPWARHRTSCASVLSDVKWGAARARPNPCDSLQEAPNGVPAHPDWLTNVSSRHMLVSFVSWALAHARERWPYTLMAVRTSATRGQPFQPNQSGQQQQKHTFKKIIHLEFLFMQFTVMRKTTHLTLKQLAAFLPLVLLEVGLVLTSSAATMSPRHRALRLNLSDSSLC